MIITRLLGGLGNQMFQYAAGLALAERHRTILKLDVSWFRNDPTYEAHNRYALSCFNITEQFATADEVRQMRGTRLTRSESWLRALCRPLRLNHLATQLENPGYWHVENRSVGDSEFLSLSDNTYIDGMFQSEKFFSSTANLLRLHYSIRYPANPAVEATAARIRSGPSIALHFRRGDYIRNPAFAREMGALNLDYYQRAIKLLRKYSPQATLYIFSDDINAVAREFQASGPHEFVRCVEPWHPWDKIRLMALCDHIVIANSTFSWWAAWLNPNPDKLVVSPEPWFTDSSHNNNDIAPLTWIRIPR